MEIKELAWNETSSKRFNNPLFPRNIRGLIVGKSNCGKTTLLLNFLLRPEWLDYDNLIVFGKSLFQPEYRILKKALEEQLSKEAIIRLFDNQNEIMRLNLSPVNLLEEMAKYQTDKSTIDCKFFESTTDVPDPRELNLNKKNLIVFDDLLLEKQNKCEAITLEEDIVMSTVSTWRKTISDSRVRLYERTQTLSASFHKT